jgi:lipopolysaccharide transport system permease protein
MRDIGQLSAFVVTVLMFASAVMFPAKLIVEKAPQLWTFLQYNPILQVVDLARHTVLWHEPMAMGKLGQVYVVAGAVFAGGAVFFALLRRSFAEVV